MRNLLVTFDGANLVQRLDVGRKSSVNAEHLLVYQLSQIHVGRQKKQFHYKNESQKVWDFSERLNASQSD